MLRADLSLFPDYKPGKSDETKLKLSANEANFGPLPTALEAIRESALRANRYPISGSPVLRKALAARLGLAEEQVVVTPGASAVIQQAVLMTCSAGDEVLFPWRSFEAYPLYARVGGATPVQVPLGEDEAIDLDAVADAITDRTRLIIICNPNNPTGLTITKDEFTEFMRRVPEDIVVVLDEAYYEFNDADDTPDGVEEIAKYPNLIGARTFSKAYGLAGLRVGYGFGNPELIRSLGLVALPLTVTELSELAAVASLEAHDELMVRVKETQAQRDRVSETLGLQRSHGNFVWIPGENGAEIEQKINAEGVIIRSYPDSGARVSITDEAEMDQFLEAWKRAGLPTVK